MSNLFSFFCGSKPQTIEGESDPPFRHYIPPHPEPNPVGSSSPWPDPIPGHNSGLIEPVDQPRSLRSMNRTRPNVRWIIGLDFGTTFSGFAYAQASGPEEISVYFDWPSRQGEKVYCKTLSGLYYIQAENGEWECVSWGHNARSDYLDSQRRNRPNGVYLSKFKLLLSRDVNDPALAASVPPPLTVHSVIVDYLRRIGEYALQVVKTHDGNESFCRDSVQWCVTVPSIWDENAKQKMKECMVDAELVSAEAGGKEAVQVEFEPEAASFHCHQMLRQSHANVILEPMDKMLVVDAGGGTVDIVVQRLLSRSFERFKVEEVTPSTGSFCGGTYVDESFMRFLFGKIECLDEFLENDVPSYRTRLLKEWGEVKCSFGHDMGSRSQTMEIDLHSRLRDKWKEHETRQGYPARESYSEIELTEKDLKSIFDPVVDEILEMIAAQLRLVSDVKVMFVVGGFAASPYLMSRIRERYGNAVQYIVCPQNPGSAVCQGAVSLSRNPDTVFSRVLRKTYGTSVTLPFRDGVDPIEYLRVGTGGVRWCRYRFDKFATKGETVEVNQCVQKAYVPHSPGQTRILFDLYSSAEENPRYTQGANVTREGGFHIDLPASYNREQATFTFSVFFGRISIELHAKARMGRGSAGREARTMSLPVSYYR